MKISEIITVDQLVQPTAEHKEHILNLCNTHYKDNVYYTNNGSHLILCAKNGVDNLGYVIALKYKNDKFKLVPDFYVAKNLYSWANDNGKTALQLILALINISTLPVLSDLEMTTSAKRFFKKNIENGILNARTFNLNNGDITAYNTDIWNKNDDFRVIFLENKFGHLRLNEHNIEIFQGTWNWLQLNR